MNRAFIPEQQGTACRSDCNVVTMIANHSAANLQIRDTMNLSGCVKLKQGVSLIPDSVCPI